MRLFILFIAFFSASFSLFPQGSEHLFRIVENGQFGFIDNKGKVVIKPQFRFAGDFYNGLARAKNDSGYGFIDKKGKFAIKPMYDYADDFYDTTALIVFQSEKYFVNKHGRLRTYTDSAYAEIKKYYNDTYALCDSTVVEITQITIENQQFSGYQIVNHSLHDTLYTYFDDVEKRFSQHEFSSPYVFRYELMLVTRNGKIFYVDNRGNTVWQAEKPDGPIGRPLNLDFRIEQESNCMLFPSNSEKYKEGHYQLDTNYLSIKAFPEETETSHEGVVGMKVRLFHHSPYADDVFTLQNPYVFFNLQIKTKEGKWIPFESQCGGMCRSIRNPHRKDTLIKIPTGFFWTFTLPTYEGTHKAQFRYSLYWALGTLYSNEFEGRYNPAQLIHRGATSTQKGIEHYFGTQQHSHEFVQEDYLPFIRCGTGSRWRCYEYD